MISNLDVAYHTLCDMIDDMKLLIEKYEFQKESLEKGIEHENSGMISEYKKFRDEYKEIIKK